MLFRVPPWLLEQYPVLNDVISALLVAKQLWHDYQGVVLVAALWFIHRQLRRERILFSEKVGTLSQIMKGIRDDAEAGLAVPATPALAPSSPVPEQTQKQVGSNNWEDIRVVWRELRDRIELAVESIERRVVRAKYADIPRYGYRQVIKALEEDDVIGTTVSTKLLTLDNLFSRLKFTPSSATEEDAKFFREARLFVDRWLPKAPQPEPSPDLPLMTVPVHQERAASVA